MTIFFTASHRGEDKYKQHYKTIIKTVESFPSVTLISPHQGGLYQQLREEEARAKGITDPKLMEYEAIRQGVHLAEAVIMEVSHESFQIGHETTLALMDKKPVLCLSLHEDFSTRIRHDYFFGKKYTERSLKGTIQDFLAHVRDLSLSKRFNLFLYPHQVEHLQTMSKKSGVNMSEYLRKLINLDKQAEANRQASQL